MPDTAREPTLRPWQPSDRDAVVALIVGIQRGEFGLAIDADDQPDLLDVHTHYQSGGGEFWVAVVGDDVVGTIAAMRFADDAVALRKMFVQGAYRGRAGLAGRLMATLLAWAASAGVRDVWLGTTDVMEAAHRFYEKHGFARVERSELPSAFPRMEVDSLFFRRTLAERSAAGVEHG